MNSERYDLRKRMKRKNFGYNKRKKKQESEQNNMQSKQNHTGGSEGKHDPILNYQPEIKKQLKTHLFLSLKEKAVWLKITLISVYQMIPYDTCSK